MQLNKAATIQYLKNAISMQKEKLKSLQDAFAIISVDTFGINEDKQLAPEENNAIEAFHPVTLYEQVKEAVEAYPANKEFITASIEQALISHDIKIKGRAPRARIATQLNQLKEEGVILRVREGKGAIPHIYCKKV
jgi:hypothetical protein